MLNIGATLALAVDIMHGDMFSEISLGFSELIATYNTLIRYYLYRDGAKVSRVSYDYSSD